MNAPAAVALFGAGVGAGTINAVVGSGTLITFPTLLALGYPPVVANVSNALGLVPGSLAAAYGYRRELEGQRARLIPLSAASLLGGLTGALLLLALPASAFKAIVPVLIGLACVLVIVQPKLTGRLRSRPGARPAHGGVLLPLGVYATGVYGGYFGAAQGVLLIALLGIFLDEDLQRVNAGKNVLAALVNGVAALVFVFAADVAWVPALVLGVGATVGGRIGAHLGRSLPAPALRWVVVAIGLIAMAKLL
ncbi:MAG TPA: sulfite exporter TauE/SafE family protein [Actinomycetota bacterium]